MAVDFLIIGGGIVGVTIALELRNRYPKQKIAIVEKESKLGLHSSGRNSGVLHSGIYYPKGTLKSEVCREGSLEMADFHLQHGLRLKQCGKVLVVADEQDAPQFDLLRNRASEQGISIEILDETQLKECEPEARSANGKAIFVPSTAVGDPAAVMHVLNDQLKQNDIKIYLSDKVSDVDVRKSKLSLDSGESLSYGHVINSAGLYADKVAHQFGCGRKYTLLPFKGIYWKLKPDANITFNHLVYPVPDLRVPFLGVHTTTTVDGSTYFGPTAVPAWGRENYYGFDGINREDLSRIVFLIMRQYVANRDGFRRLAWQEGRRYFKRWFIEAAKAIVPRLEENHLIQTDKVGIRAQMFNLKNHSLVNDFLIEQGGNSTHILNAISPAWTSAFPFARHVCDHYIQ